MGSAKSKPSGAGAGAGARPTPPPPSPVVDFTLDESKHAYADPHLYADFHGQLPPRRSFHEALMRVRDHKHDFNDIYEMMDEIGQGGICKIYKIKKKDEMMGGSSREENVRKSKSLLTRMSITRRDSSPRAPSSRPKNIQRGYSGEAPEGAHMYFALKVINLALVKEDSIDQLQNEGTGSLAYPSLVCGCTFLRSDC
jgi:hypothetical protein